MIRICDPNTDKIFRAWADFPVVQHSAAVWVVKDRFVLKQLALPPYMTGDDFIAIFGRPVFVDSTIPVDLILCREDEIHPILKYRNIHAGARILIFGNGPSWKQHDLSRITCPIIGLNQAWHMRDCTYYAAGDREQFEMYRKEHGTLETWTPLFATERDEEHAIPGTNHAIKLKPHHVNGRKRFSFDLTEGVYLNHTIASYGLQLAVWMLGKVGTIYLLGIDCTGPSFDGGEIPQYKHENQRETLAYIRGVLDVARPNIHIYTLSMVMTSFAFDRIHFNEAFPLPESTWLKL